jgi:hypothetical protein
MEGVGTLTIHEVFSHRRGKTVFSQVMGYTVTPGL